MQGNRMCLIVRSFIPDLPRIQLYAHSLNWVKSHIALCQDCAEEYKNFCENKKRDARLREAEIKEFCERTGISRKRYDRIFASRERIDALLKKISAEESHRYPVSY